MNASEAQRWMAYAKSDLDAAYLLLEKGEFFPLAKAVFDTASAELQERMQENT